VVQEARRVVIDGFAAARVAAGEANFSVHTAGRGPAVLLLHGYPQTHLIWRRLAPGWAERFTVVAPDLKGYGASDAPPPAPDSANYSKRAMAAELVALMRALGHERFAVAGHDRGGRVAYRMALDHPPAVAKLVTLDIVPTGAAWAGATRAFALDTFHWGFLAQGAGLPERLIGADPDFWLEYCCRKWAGDPAALADALDEYKRAFRRPEVIAATCADYRAGATLDDEHDRADLAAGRKIACPMLAVMSGGRARREPPEAWRQYAQDVRMLTVDCGHFIPEEAPDAIRAPVADFLAG
jgi:haloacetate dehalogenase